MDLLSKKPELTPLNGIGTTTKKFFWEVRTEIDIWMIVDSPHPKYR